MPTFDDLGTVAGVGAAAWALVQVLKRLFPELKGVATVRLVYALCLMLSLIWAAVQSWPLNGKEIANAIWAGLMAGAGAIGGNTLGDTILKPEKV